MFKLIEFISRSPLFKFHSRILYLHPIDGLLSYIGWLMLIVKLWKIPFTKLGNKRYSKLIIWVQKKIVVY
jgi:hypothetical protein